MAEKICFVISPIDEAGSPVRRHADQLLRHIIKPAVEPAYKVERADEIDRPGIITSQIIQRLNDCPLVVADLTGHNPNVFYELAIRHVVRKPLVQMIATSDIIPFDVSPIRTIKFDLADPDSVEAARQQLTKQVQSVEADPREVDNPISIAIDLGAFRGSGNPVGTQLNAILRSVLDTHDELRGLAHYLITRLADRVPSASSQVSVKNTFADLDKAVAQTYEFKKRMAALERLRDESGRKPTP